LLHEFLGEAFFGGMAQQNGMEMPSGCNQALVFIVLGAKMVKL
jgi:hypothetical protein